MSECLASHVSREEGAPRRHETIRPRRDDPIRDDTRRAIRYDTRREIWIFVFSQGAATGSSLLGEKRNRPKCVSTCIVSQCRGICSQWESEMWSLREECSINSRDQNTRRGERSYAERREKQREQEIGRRQRRLRTRPRRAMSQGKRQQERERREWEEREVA